MEPQFYILIIDDEPAIQFLHKLVIDEWNLKGLALEMPDAEYSLRFLDIHKDLDKRFLVLLDLNMPRMDGWGFLDALTSADTRAEVAVAVTTSSVNQADRTRALRYPMVVEYIEKPLDSKHLDRLTKNERIGHWIKKNPPSP